MSQKEFSPDVEKEALRQYEILKAGVTEITPEDEFLKMLKSSIETGKPLRVKCGIDPTGTDVHLGHLVPYRKMRQFQDLGHQGVVIIGDYTAQIGDPTGKNEARKSLSAEETTENARKYMEQVGAALDLEKAEIRYQSEWFKDVGLKEVLMWAAQTTAAKLLGHDTFKNRLDEGKPLALHELFYPVLQGIDSTFVDADVELGGSDQRFNVLMGRDYQKIRNKRPQVAMLLPIITGTCGSQKMSKSLGNYIGVLDEPFDKFGKVMSISDDLMEEYFRYVGQFTEDEISERLEGLKSGLLHPNNIKKELASRTVSLFHGEEVGEAMRLKFESVFKKGGVPKDAPVVFIDKQEGLLDLLVTQGLIKSKGEGRRLVKQNAIGLVDGNKITDPDFMVTPELVGKDLKIGKRKFLKLRRPGSES